ncbi:MAG: hypothetical protein H7039_04285 [Bryobacteraceae bacterium]|nr:hypothetical protein [Bryobacteraceae bacterium]
METRRDGGLRLASKNQLRLEVAVFEGQEIFSWAGDKLFSAQSVDELVGDGTTGSGDFGSFTISIFATDAAVFDYLGEKVASDGERFATYGYRVPVEMSRYQMRLPAGSAVMSYRGQFWVDPRSADLHRLTIEADKPPRESGVCGVTTEMIYHRVRIGPGTFLMPQRSVLTMIDLSGAKAVNETSYASCREYKSESTLLFQEVPPEREGTTTTVSESPLPAGSRLPGGLRLDVRLKTPIDSKTTANGDLIQGTLAKPIRGADGRVLVEAGAVLYGRVMRLEQRFLPTRYFVLGLRFDSLKVDGKTVPLTLVALPARDSGVAGSQSTDRLQLQPRAAGIGPFPIESRPGVGTFLFRQRDRLELDRKFLTEWETRSPALQ